MYFRYSCQFNFVTFTFYVHHYKKCFMQVFLMQEMSPPQAFSMISRIGILINRSHYSDCCKEIFIRHFHCNLFDVQRPLCSSSSLNISWIKQVTSAHMLLYTQHLCINIKANFPKIRMPRNYRVQLGMAKGREKLADHELLGLS